MIVGPVAVDPDRGPKPLRYSVSYRALGSTPAKPTWVALNSRTGYLAGTVKNVHFNDLRRAMIYGSVLASFCVEAFSLERLRTLSMEEIAKRYETFKLMSQFEVPL